MGLYPRFEEIVIEDREDAQIVQQGDGVRVLRKKYHQTIPLHVGHVWKTATVGRNTTNRASTLPTPNACPPT